MLRNIKEFNNELREIEINEEEDLDKIEKELIGYGITKYKIECEMAFDSPGLDVFYYAVSYIYDNQLYMFTGTFDC